MLVRSTDGTWEALEPRGHVDSGGFLDTCGDDLGPVLDLPAPLYVLARNAKLSSGKVEAICASAQGTLALVGSFFASPESAVSTLLAHAGALHGMDFKDFEKACDASSKSGWMAQLIKQRDGHPDFQPEIFEMRLSEAVTNGSFQLIAFVDKAPKIVAQSMRYLNSSGAATVLCYEVASFAGDTVSAIQSSAVDVGAKLEEVPLRMTEKGMAALAARSLGDKQGKLLAQLVRFSTGAFLEVLFDGDAESARMRAYAEPVTPSSIPLLTVVNTGDVTLDLRAIEQIDADWTIRAELVQGLSQLLGRNLGDPRSITDKHLSVTEHLMDATLMEVLTDTLSEALSLVRAAPTAAADGVPTAA